MLVSHLKTLGRHAAIYGSADIFSNVINFILVPVITLSSSAFEIKHLRRSSVPRSSPFRAGPGTAGLILTRDTQIFLRRFSQLENKLALQDVADVFYNEANVLEKID